MVHVVFRIAFVPVDYVKVVIALYLQKLVQTVAQIKEPVYLKDMTEFSQIAAITMIQTVL